MAYKEKDDRKKNREGHPNPQDGIGCFPSRLKEAMKGEGARGFSRKCDLSEGAIRSYLNGESFPTLDRLERIAVAADVDMAWLALGERGKAGAGKGSSLGAPDIDLDALETVIAKTRGMFERRNIQISLKGEARIIRLVYEYYLRQGKAMDEASLDNVIELASFRDSR